MRRTPIEWNSGRWPNFRPAEGSNPAWPYSGLAFCDPDFLDKLQDLRDRCGFPLLITSAYRSPDHNTAVSGSGPDGPHTTGRAVDIAVYGERARILIALASDTDFPGLGVQQKGPFKSRFVHLDDLETRTWSY